MVRQACAAVAGLLVACAPASNPASLGTGGSDDPVVALAQSLTTDLDDCSDAITQGPRRIVFDDFSTGAGASPNWPNNSGYSAEFNGDWDLLRGRARVGNPSWPGADRNAPPRPFTSGFVKFLDVCPLPGTTVTARALADTTEATDAITDQTLVLYLFDGAGAVLSVHASYALRAGNRRLLALRNVPLPVATRRVALVPMARLGPAEAMTVYYDDLTLEVDAAYPTVAELSDDFSTSENGAFGANQPAGWGEWGGADFFIYEGAWATVWNGAWGGEALTRPPWEGGAFKSTALPPGVRAGDLVQASVLSANTFKDPASYSMYRLTLGSRVAQSDKLFGTAWSNLEAGPVVVPAGASSVLQELLVGLGANETSSLYFDTLRVRFLRPSLTVRAAKTYSPGRDYPAVLELGATADVVVPAVLPIDTATYPGAAAPWNLAAGNAGNHDATLLFVGAAGATVTCSYRGGSSQAHPSGATQLALAREYRFRSCTNGATTGATVPAVRLEVRVANGDSNQPSTRVAVPLSWTFR